MLARETLDMTTYIRKMTYDEEIQVKQTNVDAYEQLQISRHTFETAFWFKEFDSVKEVVHALCTVETQLFCAMLKRNENFFTYARLERTYALIYAALMFPIKFPHLRETDATNPLYNNRLALLNACNARIPPFIFHLEWDKLTWGYEEVYSAYAKDFSPSIGTMKTLNFDLIRWTPFDEYTDLEVEFLENNAMASPKSPKVSLDEFEETLNDDLLMHFIHTLDESQVEQLVQGCKNSDSSRLNRFTHKTLKRFTDSTREFGGRMHLRAQLLYNKLKDVNESTVMTKAIYEGFEYDCDFWNENSDCTSESDSDSELELQINEMLEVSDDEGDECVMIKDANPNVLRTLADLYLVHACKHI